MTPAVPTRRSSDLGCTQRNAERFVVLHQRTRDAVTDRTGLTVRAATGDRDLQVKAADRLGDFERLVNQHARGFAAEVGFDGLVVDADFADRKSTRLNSSH